MSKKQLAEPFTVFKLSWLIDFFIVWWISKHKYSIFNVLICRVISLMPSANWGLILGPGNDCPYSIIHSPPPPSSLWAASLSRSNDMAPQILPICGYSSSIGLATAVLLEKRFKVYATMRNLAKKGQLEEEALSPGKSSWQALFNHLKIANFERIWFFTLDDTVKYCNRLFYSRCNS